MVETKSFEVLCHANARITERWYVTAASSTRAAEIVEGDEVDPDKGESLSFDMQTAVDGEEDRSVYMVNERGSDLFKGVRLRDFDGVSKTVDLPSGGKFVFGVGTASLSDGTDAKPSVLLRLVSDDNETVQFGLSKESFKLALGLMGQMFADLAGDELEHPLPVSVTLAIPDAQPGEIGETVLARFTTIAEAEHYIGSSPNIDAARREAGDYSINAPERML